MTEPEPMDARPAGSTPTKGNEVEHSATDAPPVTAETPAGDTSEMATSTSTEPSSPSDDATAPSSSRKTGADEPAGVASEDAAKEEEKGDDKPGLADVTAAEVEAMSTSEQDSLIESQLAEIERQRRELEELRPQMVAAPPTVPSPSFLLPLTPPCHPSTRILHSTTDHTLEFPQRIASIVPGGEPSCSL